MTALLFNDCIKVCRNVADDLSTDADKLNTSTTDCDTDLGAWKLSLFELQRLRIEPESLGVRLGGL